MRRGGELDPPFLLKLQQPGESPSHPRGGVLLVGDGKEEDVAGGIPIPRDLSEEAHLEGDPRLHIGDPPPEEVVPRGQILPGLVRDLKLPHSL
ncbi:hypothetical protein MASR2M17_13250 [Aminivibrio sp.]